MLIISGGERKTGRLAERAVVTCTTVSQVFAVQNAVLFANAGWSARRVDDFTGIGQR